MTAPQPSSRLSPRRAVWLVARREFRERLRDKSFLVSTVTVLVILGAVLFVPRLLGLGGPATYELGLAGDVPDGLGEALVAGAEAFDAEVTLHAVDDAAAGEAALERGDLDVLVIGRAGEAPGSSRLEVVTQEQADARLVAMVQTLGREARLRADLADAGVDPETGARIAAPPPVEARSLEPADPASEGRAGIAFAALMVLYGQVFGYGFAVASGVVEEKSSRVVEILLSTVRPAHLLAGKILGIGALGLLQLLLITGLALVMATVTGAITLPPDMGAILAQVVLWFALGFALYATAFATAGALVSRVEELQNVTTPLTIVVLASFFASFAALNDPGSTVARVVSFLPPAAPLAMPIRVARGAAAGWEIAVAVAIVVLTVAILVPVAGRIYAGGILRTGGAVRVREAWARRSP